MQPIRFAIVGGGWRSAFYVRVAAALPDRFAITGILSRDPGRRRTIAASWAVPVPVSLHALLADAPAFVLVAVPWAATPELIAELSNRGVAVLAETPPAPDLAGLRGLRRLFVGGARVQVAEQYQFQPLHAARLALIGSGRLGSVSETQVSVAHGYHGIDLIRRYLGLGFEPVSIRARRFSAPIVAGPGRDGPPSGERIVTSEQVIATIEASDRLGVLDFTDDQYFSWIRALRLLVRGERGEIVDATVRYLADYRTPVSLELVRREAGRDGNLEGLYLDGITAGADWLYRNPFVPARLTDDEIAVATCVQRMADYLDGGPSFCGLDEAAQDHYLSLLVDEAAASGHEVRSVGHVWDA